VTFDEDLILAVQQEAPPGVHFDREEVERALVKAADRLSWSYFGMGPVVELAAERVLRARQPQPEKAPEERRSWWRLYILG
jgi:hypothetical protein